MFMGKVEQMHKKFILIFTIIVLVLFSGCNKKEEEKKESKNTVAPKAIKVTKNVVTQEHKEEKSKENSGQFYYSYNKENNSSDYNSENTKVRTTIDAYLHIKSPYERVKITMMIKRLSHDYVVKCSACHDDYANGIIGPSLLDKDSDFIFERIMDFKTGKKENVLMKELVKQIDDKKLKELAVEIANFNKEIRKMRNAR